MIGSNDSIWIALIRYGNVTSLREATGVAQLWVNVGSNADMRMQVSRHTVYVRRMHSRSGCPAGGMMTRELITNGNESGCVR
jgi:hypothetical protein